MTLPVHKESTTVDILFSCSDSMIHPVNTSCSVVLEKYTQLGLERRLRRYERVKDVLNSWDRDTQNQLVVVPSETYESDKDLDLPLVPTGDEPPQGFILQLHHSQRPGKWHKRFITLLESGQMYVSKKAAEAGPAEPNPSIHGKDGAAALCHLSDFDIYTPTEAQMRKHLKPPKRFCYAIKSQQKTHVVETAENFVHFFCTEDAAVAAKFHAFVHAWRSWYLVHREVELARKTRRKLEIEKAPQITSVRHKPQKSISHVRFDGHRVRVSVDATPYAIGAFQPLLDLGRFDKPIEDFGKDWLPDTARQSAMPPPLRPGLPASEMQLMVRPADDAADATFGPNDVAPSATLSASFSNGLDPLPTDEAAAVPLLPMGDASSSASSSPVELEKPEPPSWFPSASAHTARLRSQSLKDVARPSILPGTPHNDRRRPPPPRSNPYGNGIKLPSGMPPFDSSGDGPPRFLEVPARNGVRPGLPRGKTGTLLVAPPAPSPGRQRSKSAAGMTRREHVHPPMPPLPRASTRDGGNAGFGGRMGDRDRGRDPRPRDLTAGKRSGTGY
jgi:hypothetical protein